MEQNNESSQDANQAWQYDAERRENTNRISRDARMWAMICHLAGLAGFAIPIIVSNMIAPFVIWQIKKEDDPFIDENGKEALNFQISISIYELVCIPLIFACVGIPLLAAVIIFDLVCIIIAAVKSNNGEYYRYPFTIRLIK
jgi:uncharacterized Tic20 family protein